MRPVPRLLPAGDSAIVAEYGDGIDTAINARVRSLQRALEAGAHDAIIETVPTYRSLMVHYDPMVLSHESAAALIAATAERLPEEAREAIRTIEIPVLYGGDAGPDLEDVAALAGLDAQAVVDLHAGGEYVVFMLGFMPGFPYLGGLPVSIATPRLPTPRTLVPAGSVGIAGAQTGIYPTASPGGWRLIGQTPVRLFDPRLTPPALLEPGDHLRFVPVSRPQYDAVAREVAAGTYRPAVRVQSGGA
jgi:KipI family sensor histidine kinase inhibitor